MQKRWFCLLTALILIVSTFAMMPVQSLATTEQASIQRHSSGGFDLGIANDEKLIEMLKKQGSIDSNATQEEAYMALQAYLNRKALSASKMGATGGEEVNTGAMFDPNNRNGFLNGKGLKKGQTKDTVENAISDEPFNGTVKEDNILVLLIDFPDYRTGQIEPSETDLFYDEYPKAYYEQMMFGEEGFAGPEGQNLISMKQYFEAQSGGSYTVTGAVNGWYTAKENAAYYGGNARTEEDIEDGITDPNLYTGSDLRPRELVLEALEKLAAEEFDFSKFDENTDGIIDHIMVMHAGPGEEAGGGDLENNAIWSHSWGWDKAVNIPGSDYKAYNYTIQPEDAATGVCAHEFGHDLGLPDEYDTGYTGSGEPVSYWSIMSSGSWAGEIPGTEPTGFSPYGKLYFQGVYGENWIKGRTIDLDQINKNGTEFVFDQASMKGANDDVVVVTLPEKSRKMLAPYAGGFSYFSGSENDMTSSMSIDLDLTDHNSAVIDFMNWFQIETGYDYLHYQVYADGEWIDLDVIDSFSEGWEQRSYDLSNYSGKEIKFRALYLTDGGYLEAGVYLDNIAVSIDGQQIAYYDAETAPADGLTLGGFTRNSGFIMGSQYYILEWRNHDGVDQGLGHIVRGNDLMSYDPGLVVWYVDNTYTDNFVGLHPGRGYIGVVDADQNILRWNGNTGIASTRYQMHDAAFNLNTPEMMSVAYPEYGMLLTDKQNNPQPLFADSSSYISSQIPDAGRIVPNYGIKIRVTAVSSDQSAAKILIYK